MVPEILSRIRAPIFRAHDFVITSFGAVANGETDNTEAFRRAIVECNSSGGGRVVVPPVSFVIIKFPGKVLTESDFSSGCFSN